MSDLCDDLFSEMGFLIETFFSGPLKDSLFDTISAGETMWESRARIAVEKGQGISRPGVPNHDKKRRLIQIGVWALQQSLKEDSPHWLTLYHIGKMKLKLGVPVSTVLRLWIDCLARLPKNIDKELLLDVPYNICSLIARALHHDQLDVSSSVKFISELGRGFWGLSDTHLETNYSPAKLSCKTGVYTILLNQLERMHGIDKKKMQHRLIYRVNEE
jgi:hypothetical protein